MSLDDLAAVAFKNGCDITLAYALRTERYDQLLRLAKRYRLRYPEETAMAEYLGERLADRAARNLPPRLIHSLSLWDDGFDTQLILIDMILEHLRTDAWRKLNPDVRNRYNASANNALPARTGTWLHGRFIPNCLGTAQMLVGLARMMGAEHYLVTVNRTAEMEATYFDYQVFSTLAKIIEPYSSGHRRMSSMVSDLRQSSYARLKDLDDLHAGAAHHAIMLKLADGTWRVVDPYLGVTQTVEGSGLERMLKALDATNHQHYLRQSLSPGAYTERLRVDRQLGNIDFLLNKVIAPADDNGYPPGSLLIRNLAAMIVLSNLEPEYAIGMWEKAAERKLPLYDLMLETFSTPEPYRSLYHLGLVMGLAQRKSADTKGIPAIVTIDELLARASANPTVRRRSCLNVLAYFAQTIAWQAPEVWTRRKLQYAHPTIEMASPALALGVATMNHLRQWYSIPIGGMLAALSSSQWILADTFAAAERGDTIAPEIEPIIRQRLIDLKRDSDKSKTKPIISHLQERVRQAHGQTRRRDPRT